MPVFFKGTSGSGNANLDNLIYSYIASADGDIDAGDLCDFVNGSTIKRTFKDTSNMFNPIDKLIGSNHYKVFNIATNICAFFYYSVTAYVAILDYSDPNRIRVLSKKKLSVLNESMPDLRVSMIDATSFIITFCDQNNWYIWGKVVTITATTYNITVGSATQITTDYGYSQVLSDKIGTNRFVLMYYRSTTTYAVCLKVVSGSIIVGTIASTTSAVAIDYSNLKVVVDSSTSYVLAVFRSGSASNYYMYATMLTIIDMSVTFNTMYAVTNTGTSYISVTQITSTKFVVTYSNETTYYLWSVVMTVDNSQLTFGALYVCSSIPVYWKKCIAIDETHILVFCSGSYVTAFILTISGSYISASVPVTAHSNTFSIIDFLSLGQKAFLIFSNVGNDNSRPKAMKLSITDIYGFPAFYTTARDAKPKFLALNNIIATNSGKCGVKGLLNITGAVLTPGAIYYCDIDGKLSKTISGYEIGVAVTPTELLLKKPFWERGA